MSVAKQNAVLIRLMHARTYYQLAPRVPTRAVNFVFWPVALPTFAFFQYAKRSGITDIMAFASSLYNWAPGLSSGFVVCIVLGCLWLGATVAYRLFFSPIAGVPGPRLAALTGWYETYYDCVKQGRFWREIEKMHEEYGTYKCRIP